VKDQLIAIALEAGAAILPLFQTGTASRTKADGSPVTLADGLAERIILERLAIAFPDIQVVAEESASEGHVPSASDRFFLVDPLDGTREFVSGNGEFTVNIGLVEAGVPVVGVVMAPALGTLFHGDRSGAFEARIVDGVASGTTRLHCREVPEAGCTIVASRSHRTPETDAFIARYPVGELVSAGSSLKFCSVAAGRADLYPRLGRTMEWDTAAADAVLRAAGGQVLTLDGLALRYGKRNQADDSDFANPWFVATGGLGLPA
jgi:3'(2'),5'-bisphosphate nucleotidase